MMRPFIISGSVAFCLTNLSVTAYGSEKATPLQSPLWQLQERPNTVSPKMDMEWRWKPSLRWLTFPLCPVDQTSPSDRSL